MGACPSASRRQLHFSAAALRDPPKSTLLQGVLSGSLPTQYQGPGVSLRCIEKALASRESLSGSLNPSGLPQPLLETSLRPAEVLGATFFLERSSFSSEPGSRSRGWSNLLFDTWWKSQYEVPRLHTLLKLCLMRDTKCSSENF